MGGMSKYINPRDHFRGAFIPLWLLALPDISAGAKLVYARLAFHADDTGVAWPKQETLAQELGSSRRVIQRNLEELVQYGLIECQVMGLQMSNRYRFLMHQTVHPDAPDLVHPDAPDLVHPIIKEGSLTIETKQGYGDAPKSNPKTGKGQILEDAVQTVIQHLNHVTGRRFTSKSAANLRARIRESGDVPGAIIVCKLIVDYKWSEWKDDDRMREFVNSDTLFKPTHWERYSQAAIAWNNSGRASKNGQQDLRSKFEAMVGVQP